MQEYFNEKFLDMILEEYPEFNNQPFTEEYQDGLLFNAVTIAQFPGMRIDLLIIRGEDDTRR
tara:strand:- start:341 stop:526 length:186 start_codon:yes stop_codon:yes gene_type:complete